MNKQNEKLTINSEYMNKVFDIQSLMKPTNKVIKARKAFKGVQQRLKLH